MKKGRKYLSQKTTANKKFVRFLTAFVLTLSIVLMQIPVFASEDTSVQITIFHTNDMHGRLLDSYNTSGTLTQIGTDVVTSIRNSVPDSLLIDAGDAVQGLPFATISKGADVIRLMNAAGYDGMILGNHEFDYGKDQAFANAKLANFPVVSANTFYNGSPFLSDVNGNNGANFTKTVKGVKIGFFGLTTVETTYKTNPSNLSGVTFADPIATAQAEVAKLKSQGCSVIICISHIGGDGSNTTESGQLAENVDGIDVIIDGHSHTIENASVNDTLIVQTGSTSKNLGRLDITIDTSGNVSATENLISAEAAGSYPPDAEVAKLANEIKASQDALFQDVVGHTSSSFWGGTVNNTSIGRLTETNLGDLVTDAMVYSAKSQVEGSIYETLPIIALENGGGIRDSILSGDITQGDVTTVLPFGNILSLKVVTPTVLFSALENGVSKIKINENGIISGADGRFPQISGLRFEYNPNNAAGNRVTKVVLLNSDGSDSQVLDKNDSAKQIVLASNDYEVGGGDGYTMFGSLANIGEGTSLDVILSDYITKLTNEGNGTFSYPSSKNRITVANTTYSNYNAAITLSDELGKVANQSILYVVDGNIVGQENTDNNGLLTLSNLSAGPHTISIYVGDKVTQVYINNIINNISVAVTVSAQIQEQKNAVSVITQILALPSTLTINNKVAVNNAKIAYDSLTVPEKALVANSTTLTMAVTTISKLDAELVTSQIKELPDTITLGDEAKIIAARNAYNALSPEAKSYVGNLSKLITAETFLSQLKQNAVKVTTSATTQAIAKTPNTGDRGYSQIVLASMISILVLTSTLARRKKLFMNK